MRSLTISMFMLVIVLAFSCKNDDEPTQKKSSGKEIISFSLSGQTDSATIDTAGKQIVIWVTATTDLKTLKPFIKVSENATINPSSGSTVDFSTSPVKFLVTAEDGTTQEWSVYVNRKVEKYVIQDLNKRQISAIILDNMNNLWIGTDTGLFKKVSSGSYELQALPIQGKIISLSYEKTKNVIWIGTSAGLVKAALGTDINYSIVPTSNFSNNIINVTYIDPNTRYWFGTNIGITLNVSDIYKKKDFVRNANNLDVPINGGAEEAPISSIASWDGDYYFATLGYGLFRAYGFNSTYDGFTGATSWSAPYNGDAISDSMFVVFVDSKGNQWMGGTSGLQVHSGHDAKAENNYMGDNLPSLRIRAIAEASNGDIWIGTEKGLVVYNGTTWTNKSDKFITAIAFESTGTAWVGTNKGLIKL